MIVRMNNFAEEESDCFSITKQQALSNSQIAAPMVSKISQDPLFEEQDSN